MAKHCEPVDPQLIISHGISVIRNTTVLECVLESVVDSVANGISNTEIRAAFEKTLEMYDR
jgi:hypothetical protein